MQGSCNNFQPPYSLLHNEFFTNIPTPFLSLRRDLNPLSNPFPQS